MGGDRAAATRGERARLFSALPPKGVSVEAAGVAHEEPARSWRAWLVRLRQRLGAGILDDLGADAARGAGFLCLPVLMAAGAAFYVWLPREPAILAPVLAIVLFSASVWLARDRLFLAVILAALLVFALGIGAATFETRRASTPMVGSDVTTNVTGRLVLLEHRADGRVRLTLDLVATERPHLNYPPDRVRLTARAVPPGVRPGDGVKGLARLMSPSGPVRPGAYDFSFASYFNGLGAVGFFMSGPERVALEEPLPPLARPARWLETAREALAARIRSQVDGPEGAVAVAMITGFRAGIPEEINEWLRRAGLAHILAISGLHMALVAVTVMAMLRAGAAVFPGFSSSVPVKKYAAAAALLMCTLYLFISGAAVAAQRSYIMLAVMLMALIVDRAAITMRNVAIAALIIVAWSPHVVVGPSFQMSFAATAALVAGYAAWTDWRRRRERGMPPRGLFARMTRYGLGFALGLAMTSLIAGSATALYGVWHFQRATPLGLPANLVAMPLVSLVAMPSAVLAMLALPFGLDGFFLNLMGRAIGAVIAVAEWFSERTPVDAVGLIPLPAVLCLTVALVILVVSTTRLRLAALPLILAGTALIANRDLPHLLVTEDARLMGLRAGEGELAINRSRFSSYAMDDWRRALVVETLIKPETHADDEGVPPWPEPGADGFQCNDDLCLARHPSGALVAHAKDPVAARALCGHATLIVLDDATVDGLCDMPPDGASPTRVVTKRELARKGALAVRFEAGPAGVRPRVTFAVGEDWRPWHTHRAWSRAARGLPPYRSKED